MELRTQAGPVIFTSSTHQFIEFPCAFIRILLRQKPRVGFFFFSAQTVGYSTVLVTSVQFYVAWLKLPPPQFSFSTFKQFHRLDFYKTKAFTEPYITPKIIIGQEKFVLAKQQEFL